MNQRFKVNTDLRMYLALDCRKGLSERGVVTCTPLFFFPSSSCFHLLQEGDSKTAPKSSLQSLSCDDCHPDACLHDNLGHQILGSPWQSSTSSVNHIVMHCLCTYDCIRIWSGLFSE